MEKQKKNPNVSHLDTLAVEECYNVITESGEEVQCRSYEPITKIENPGVIIFGTGFGTNLDYAAPVAKHLADLCGEEVITLETSITDREPQKIEDLLALIKDTIKKCPDQKISFILPSEAGNYGSKAILEWLQENPEPADSIGQVVFVGSAGLLEKDSCTRTSLRFIRDSVNVHYPISDLGQTKAYMGKFMPEFSRNMGDAFKVIDDIARSDTRKAIEELRKKGVSCNLISGHSDKAFPVSGLEKEIVDKTKGKKQKTVETVHDQEFINRRAKHSTLYYRPEPIQAVADILTSNNHPEVWHARASARYEDWKNALERIRKKLGISALSE